MRKIIFASILLLSQLYAMEAGVAYKGPQKLTLERVGISFMLPSGWSASLIDSEKPLILKPDNGDAEIIFEYNIKPHIGTSELLHNYIEFYSLKLNYFDSIKNISSHIYYREYDVGNSELYNEAELFVVRGSRYRAAMLYGFYTPRSKVAVQNTLLNISESITFTQSYLPIYNSNSPLDTLLRGEHFVFYERYGSYSEKRELWLCSDNTMLLTSTQSSVRSNSRVKIAQEGTWSLFDNELLLYLGDSNIKKYTVLKKKHTLYINEEQTFKLPNNYCN